MIWIITAVAISGALLSALGETKYMPYACGLWIVSNGYLTIHNYLNNDPAQAVMFLVYLGISAMGLRAWILTKKQTVKQYGL